MSALSYGNGDGDGVKPAGMREVVFAPQPGCSQRWGEAVPPGLGPRPPQKEIFPGTGHRHSQWQPNPAPVQGCTAKPVPMTHIPPSRLSAANATGSRGRILPSSPAG